MVTLGERVSRKFLAPPPMRAVLTGSLQGFSCLGDRNQESHARLKDSALLTAPFASRPHDAPSLLADLLS